MCRWFDSARHHVLRSKLLIISGLFFWVKQWLNKKLDELKSSAFLEVDGGINAETLPKMKDAGANVFVAAHAVFGYPQGIEAGMRALREAINQLPAGRTRNA